MEAGMLDRIADGRTDLVFDHLAEGGVAGATDEDGVSLIAWCAYYGDVSAIRYLLLRGESLDSLGPGLGLNAAAFHGHWRLCQFLLEEGADPNTPLPHTAETPLHSALCKPGRPAYDAVVRVLLAAGADPNRATTVAPTGAFARDCRTRGETPLHRAAAFGSAEAIQMLLDRGAVVDARDVNGDTPLAWASWHERPGAILNLLCYGDIRVSRAAVRNWRSDHGAGWGNPMEVNLLGEPHVGRPEVEPEA
jgi:uncharacterized protein